MRPNEPLLSFLQYLSPWTLRYRVKIPRHRPCSQQRQCVIRCGPRAKLKIDECRSWWWYSSLSICIAPMPKPAIYKLTLSELGLPRRSVPGVLSYDPSKVNLPPARAPRSAIQLLFHFLSLQHKECRLQWPIRREKFDSVLGPLRIVGASDKLCCSGAVP